MVWLTIGLLIFAGVQVGLQARTEWQRRLERRIDQDEAIDRAFHQVWAEHFRLDSLADELDRRDLIEMSLLGVLRSDEVLPHDWGKLTEAMATLSREAGFLGGTAITLCHDVERAICVLAGSIESFATHGPVEVSPPERVQWLRQRYGEDVAPWEAAVRTGVRDLADLLWDVARHNPRVAIDRHLNFSDELRSRFAEAAVRALVSRSSEGVGGESSNR